MTLVRLFLIIIVLFLIVYFLSCTTEPGACEITFTGYPVASYITGPLQINKGKKNFCYINTSEYSCKYYEVEVKELVEAINNKPPPTTLFTGANSKFIANAGCPEYGRNYSCTIGFNRFYLYHHNTNGYSPLDSDIIRSETTKTCEDRGGTWN
jgi:hypothetical protein